MARMNFSERDKLPAPRSPENRCLSCGTRENMGRRRYCSIQCRQRLRFKLSLRTGLLRALNTRYATFSFTEQVVILNVLPYDDRRIFSFICRRARRRTPAEDFSRLADLLGNVWWEERRRSQKKYLANRSVFNQAVPSAAGIEEVLPLETNIPSVNGNFLIRLQIGRTELKSPALKNIIKSAYRLQVKKHHPDLGGSSAMFRKIQAAYEELLQWSESPTFVMRRGFPDKWFYNGQTNRWVQPTAAATGG